MRVPKFVKFFSRPYAVTIPVTRAGREVQVRVLCHVEYDSEGMGAKVRNVKPLNTRRRVKLTWREEDRAIFRALAVLV